MAFPSEKEAKDIAEKRALAKQAQAFAATRASPNDFYNPSPPARSTKSTS
jgi:hypothetical protein